MVSCYIYQSIDTPVRSALLYFGFSFSCPNEKLHFCQTEAQQSFAAHRTQFIPDECRKFKIRISEHRKKYDKIKLNAIIFHGQFSFFVVFHLFSACPGGL